MVRFVTEVESSRTSLASRTHFEVVGLGLEGQVFKKNSSKLQALETCTVLGSRTALIFEQLKFRWKTPETSRKICEYLFCFRLSEHRRSQGKRDQGARPFPPNLNFSNEKNGTKKSIVFSVSVSF